MPKKDKIARGRVVVLNQKTNRSLERQTPCSQRFLQNQDQNQAQVKNSSTMDFFKTYYTYLTIGCLYLIKYVFETRLLGMLSFVYGRKYNVYGCRYANLAPLNNRINFFIVNCLQHVL